MELVIPGFPCDDLPQTIAFYKALGFAITHEQTEPYMYAAVELGNVHVHFSDRFGSGKTKQSSASCLVMVEDIAGYFERFSSGLRQNYGRIPTAGFPRLTRLWHSQTRFHIFDPNGNILLFIDVSEPPMDYAVHETHSALEESMAKAVFLRDTYTDDVSAAKMLHKAVLRHTQAPAVERARAWAMLAELAIALGDAELIAAARTEQNALQLSAQERTQYEHELALPERLQHWMMGE